MQRPFRFLYCFRSGLCCHSSNCPFRVRSHGRTKDRTSGHGNNDGDGNTTGRGTSCSPSRSSLDLPSTMDYTTGLSSTSRPTICLSSTKDPRPSTSWTNKDGNTMSPNMFQANMMMPILLRIRQGTVNMQVCW